VDPLLPYLIPRIVLLSIAAKGTWLLLGYLASQLKAAQQRRIYRLPVAMGQRRREALTILPVLIIDAIFLLTFRHMTGLKYVPTTPVSFILAFTWVFVGFELWFYVLHWLMHTKPLYWIHAQHHVAHVTDPLTSLSFSVAERVLLMGGGLAIAGIGAALFPFANAGLLAYLVVNYALVVFQHSNVEWLPTWFVRSWLGKIFFTPTFHALHHARFQGNYGLFMVTLDRLFGTQFHDYEAVHARAWSGAGLARLGERVSPASADHAVVPEFSTCEC